MNVDAPAPVPEKEAPPPSDSLEWLQKWVTTIGALIALVLSITNFLQLNRAPPIQGALPRLLRLAQGSEVWLYLQPTYVSTRETAQR
ncbi:hypothetical protein [Myxococcus stipitatus]|uniref:hypothetical protein n=1 Tax=Myxococcus stipitatus TaxID=83455 RepID=UPI0002DC81DB|nr:hypothetical protein [Myxococcus stipitatus]